MASYLSDSLPDEEWNLLNRKAKQYLQDRGAVFEDVEGFYCSGMPSVTLVSLVDDQIDKRDFAGCIHFRKNSRLNSYHDSPFPHDIVRITVVKTRSGTGRVVVGASELNGTSIVAYEKVEIGDNVLFGPNVVIMDCDGHRLDRQRAEAEGDFPEEIRPVSIGRGCWVGYGALILKGVTLGEYAVVAANSVVTKSVPPYTVVGGNPARVIRTLKAPQPGG